MADQDTTQTQNRPEDDPDNSLRSTDGAVRQLDKAAIIASRGAGSSTAAEPEAMEVIPLAKDPGGAPEEDAADASDLSNQT